MPSMFNLSMFVLADIQGSCAIKGDGLYEGLDWLKTTLTQQRLTKTLVKPVKEMEKTLPTSKKDSIVKSLWNSASSYFVKAS